MFEITRVAVFFIVKHGRHIQVSLVAYDGIGQVGCRVVSFYADKGNIRKNTHDFALNAGNGAHCPICLLLDLTGHRIDTGIARTSVQGTRFTGHGSQSLNDSLV